MDFKPILQNIGLQSEGLLIFLNTIVSLFLIGLFGWIAYMIARKYLAHLIIKIAGHTSSDWDNLLFDKKFFRRLGVLAAAAEHVLGIARPVIADADQQHAIVRGGAEPDG